MKRVGTERVGIRTSIVLFTLMTVGTACASQGTLPNQAGRSRERPPAPGTAITLPATMQAVTAPNTDPTVGKLINETRWRVEVFIDAEPNSLGITPSITLNPRDTRPAHLDFGPHRVIALAFVDTQFGTRIAGQFDRTIQIDPRGGGWSLRLTEGVFR